MELERAQNIARQVIDKLSPHCRRIEVAGSVRRGKYQVKDIDFVLIPSDAWALHQAIALLGNKKMGGEKLQRIQINDVQLDFYFATDKTWATLLLIRTGSAANNIRLCSAAKKRGWHLAASGDGLFDENGTRIAGDTEESIYQALGLKYQPPAQRN